MRYSLLFLFMVFSLHLALAQDGATHHRDKVVKRINYTDLLKRSTFKVAQDSLHDITSVSYIRSRGFNLITYKAGRDSDSLKLIKVYPGWRVERMNIPLGSDADARFIYDKGGYPLNNIVIMSYGDQTMQTIISEDNGAKWSHHSTDLPYYANHLDGTLKSSKLGSIVYFSDKRGRYIASDTTHSVIYQMSTDDNGYSWSVPKVAVKCNLHSVSDPYVFVSKSKRYPNLMIMQGKDYIPMLSYNDGTSDEWSYPESLSKAFRGDLHKVLIYKKFVFVLYRERAEDGSPGNIVLWKGSLADILKGEKDNSSRVYLLTGDGVDNSDMCSSELAIMPILKGSIFVLCSTKWEDDRPAYLMGFKIKKRDIKSGKLNI